MQTPYPEPPREQPSALYPAGRRDTCFAAGLLCLLLLLANCIVTAGFFAGYAVCSLAVMLLTLWYLGRGSRITPFALSCLASAAALSACFVWSADTTVKLLLFLLQLFAWFLSLCLLRGTGRRDPGHAGILADAAAAAFLLPFREMGGTLRGLSYQEGADGPVRRRTGGVLLGLALAVPALALLLPLLISSDAAFEGLMRHTIFSDLNTLFATLVLGALLFLPSYCRSAALRRSRPMSAEAAAPYEGKLPAMTLNTFLGALSFFYMLYLFSQLAYFFSAFSGILPPGYTAAQYARRGFFEMCTVCAMNLGLLALAAGLVRRDSCGIPRSTRALCLFICLFCLTLVAASAAKMNLYISSFGLTRLRILTSVFMAFLGIAVLSAAIWLLRPGFPYMKVIISAGLIFAIAIGWADVDTQVARYNVEAYQSGALQSIDMDTLSELSAGATPYLVRLLDDPDLQISDQAGEILTRRILRLYQVKVGPDGLALCTLRSDAGLRGWCAMAARERQALEPIFTRLTPSLLALAMCENG